MNEDFIARVRRAIEDRPRLTALFSSTHNIPERLAEYNENLFICHNVVTGRFEIHSLENKGNTLCGELPYKALDARTLHWVWENDIRVHGRAIFERLDRQEKAFEDRKKREFKNWVEDVASETRSMFAKDAWSLGT